MNVGFNRKYILYHGFSVVKISSCAMAYIYIYRVIQKDVLNFVRLYFLNYTWHVNDLHNI